MENKDINSVKNEFRRNIRNLKSLLSDVDKKRKSNTVFAEVEKHERFNLSEVVMMYWSLPDELQTHDAVKRFSSSKTILLPVVNGDTLELRKFTGEGGLSSDNSLGIGEPAGKAYTELEKIDMIIVPGVAFDRQNNRLGRGKAYYDKLLKEVKAYKIGVCFDFQFFDEIPFDENDVKMDEVIYA